MSITDRVTAAVAASKETATATESTRKAMEFVEAMERHGVLRRQEYTVVAPTEGKLETLRALVPSLT